MTTDNTRALLEQALEVIVANTTGKEDLEGAIRSELAKPEQVEPVAWMDEFGNVFPIGARKNAGSWMDAYQRNWKPLYLHPPTPAWHDEPVCAGFWLNSINQRAMMFGEINYMVWRQTGARWYGPIPQDTEAEGGAA